MILHQGRKFLLCLVLQYQSTTDFEQSKLGEKPATETEGGPDRGGRFSGNKSDRISD